MEKVKSKEKTKVDTSIVEKAKEQSEIEKQVIVHCTFSSMYPFDTAIRIWPSTLLLDKESEHKSILLHYENIKQFPDWMLVQPFQKVEFTLIFSALPKACKVFDLLEVIPETGGFEVKDIKRNQLDVYHVNL